MNTNYMWNENDIYNMTRTKFVYIDEYIVDCRLHGIYKQIVNANYKKAYFNIIDMLINLNNHEIVNIENKFYNKIIDTFFHMRVEMSIKKYEAVHNRVRDLHYKIINN